jgi:signal transduction histidine kinase/ligand-binding sensor domain-containing protein
MLTKLKIYFSCLVLFTGILIPVFVHSQFTDLHFKHLTPNDGLTQGVITDIFTDSKGFVWMTGMDGINRFDGSHCLANNEIAPGLQITGRTIKTVEDKNGDIWFGYSEGLIQYSYRSNRFTTHQLTPPPVINSNEKKPEIYSPLASDNENNLLIGIKHNIGMLYNSITKQIQYIRPPIGNDFSLGLYFPPNIQSLKKGWKCVLKNNDSIWVCTFTGQQPSKNQWVNKGFKWTAGISSSVYMPDENTLFFNSNGRICKYHLSAGESSFSTEVKTNTNLFFFTPDAKGHLWIGGANNGLYVLDTATMQIRSHITYNKQEFSGISNDNVFPFVDRNQILWVIAWGKGVDYVNLKDEKFTSFLKSEDVANYQISNFIRGITEVPGGDFYCSTQSGISILDKELRFKKLLSSNTQGIQIPDIMLHNSKVYYTSDAENGYGFYQYDMQTGGIKNFAANEIGFKENLHAYQISKTSSGNLLVASLNGLWKFNVEKQQIEILPGITNYNKPDVVVCSYEDAQQQIYKCLNNLGFSVYRKSGIIYKEVFAFNKKITIKHIVPQNDSLLWMAASDGLYMFNTRRLKMVKQYTMKEGLPNNIVYAIMPDEKDNLWLSTNKGLSYFNIEQNTFTNFSIDDGLQANEFNTHVVLRAKDGRIIFGGVNGLTVVNPKILLYQLPAPVLQITAVKSDTIYNPYPFNEKGSIFNLYAGTSSFEMEMTAINFNTPAFCKIRYQLLGYEKEWQYMKNTGTFRYSKLPPGKYTLQAMASNPRGEYNGDMKELAIVVHAYWWQTTWFKIICLFIFMLLIWLFIAAYLRYKLNRQKEKLEKKLAIQAERERIIADLHDDVGATLSSMHIYGDLAGNILYTKPEESRKLVEKISHNSRELMGRMGDIIWSMKPADEEKYSFTARLKNYSNELLASKNIRSDFDIDENISKQIINPEARKNILLIAKEAMNNIAKYSEASKADISLRQQNDLVLLTINDNGKGYDAGNILRGNGLGNMELRCKQLGGKCNTQAEPGKGVTIICSFPKAIISHSE